MRIVQLSDLHLKPGGGLAYGGADTIGALDRVIAHVNGLKPAPDVVIVTGDIADGGLPGSYTLARERLSTLLAPVFMVPGNHDHKARMAEAFPDHDYLQTAPFVCFAVEAYPVRLVGVDTVTPGEHGGGLCLERLAWLDATLAARPRTPTLIFMHHPPFPSGIGHMDLEPFRNRDLLGNLLRRHPQVERLTSGHIHRPIVARFGGTAATVCPGVGMHIPMDLRPEAPAGFRLGPSGILVHCLADGWGDGPPELLTHVDLVEDVPGQWGSFHPFYDVVSPR